VHQRLGDLVVLRRPALDEVRRQRERCAGEPDERRRAQLADQRADGLVDERDVAGLERAQLVEVGAGADGAAQHRADARLHVDVDTHGTQRHHDVGVEDGGVDPVPADRL
jgi:hypothetical protein